MQIELIGRIREDQWMAFGLSGQNGRPQMVKQNNILNFLCTPHKISITPIILKTFSNAFRWGPMLLSHFMIKYREYFELRTTIYHTCHSVMESRVFVLMNASVVEMM